MSDYLWIPLFGVMAVIPSLALVGVMLALLPEDYFLKDNPHQFLPRSHPAVRGIFVVLKNLLGIAIIALGILLSLPAIPGQGVLTVLVGLIMLDFPGKHRLERCLARPRRVRLGINRIRRWCRKDEMRFELWEKDNR